MPNLFATLVAPAPGVEFGAPVNISAYGPKKTFTILGTMGGANIIVQGSNKLVPGNDWVPLLQFTSTDDNKAREIDGSIQWIRIQRQFKAGSTPITIGLSGEGACPCEFGPTPPLGYAAIISVPMRSENEGSVASSDPLTVLGENLVNLDALGSPISSRLDLLARTDTALSQNADFYLQTGGTPGVADGVDRASLLAQVLPNVAAPNGTAYALTSGDFANPGGTQLVKLVMKQNLNGTGFVRASTALFAPMGVL